MNVQLGADDRQAVILHSGQSSGSTPYLARSAAGPDGAAHAAVPGWPAEGGLGRQRHFAVWQPGDDVPRIEDFAAQERTCVNAGW